MFVKYDLRRDFKVENIFSCFEAERSKDFYFNGEAHDSWEMVFVEEGIAGIAEDDRIYELHAGEVILHKPFEFHKIWAAGNGKELKIIIISFDVEGELPLALEEGKIKLSIEMQGRLTELFKLGREVIAARKNNMRAAEHEFALRTELFLIDLSGMTEESDNTLKTTDALRFKKIINVMKEHVEENLTVAEIAFYAGMSQSNLKSVFAKFTDGGIKNHFNAMRIRHSIELLKKGMRVGEISEHMSYSSQNYYSLAFKREMGYAPMTYKTKFL